MNMIFNTKFVLASTSKSRYFILKNTGLSFSKRAPLCDENKLKKKLKINDSQWFMDIENLGNTVSATLPIAISTLKNNGSFPENKNICLMGFGVGLSVAGCIIR